MKRIVIGCFEVPGWGGLTTATYRLFESMLDDGLDVHYVNLLLREELERFHGMLGPDCENPRGLRNVHSCYLGSALHEDHPELTELLDVLAPDVSVGVGDISTYLMKRANPERELVFLTAGCMQVKRDVPFTEQWAAMRQAAVPAAPDWKEREAMAIADLVLTHSPMVRDLYLHLYPGFVDKIHKSVFWFAEWIARDAKEHSTLGLPFSERDIDALFIASSWARGEKNSGLVGDIVSQIPHLSIHVVGEFAESIPGATHHGFVNARSDLFHLMGRARTVVSPSLFDAAPGILFEGSIMGCNVVTSRNCGNWELCNDSLLVDDYGPGAFAAAITRARLEKLPDNMARFLEPSSYVALQEVLTGYRAQR